MLTQCRLTMACTMHLGHKLGERTLTRLQTNEFQTLLHTHPKRAVVLLPKSQNSPKCAVWPFGPHRAPQEPQMTEIGAQMSQNSPKCAAWPFGTHRAPQEPQMTE